jgi:hypothetical protein
MYNMAETEIKSINGRLLCDQTARNKANGCVKSVNGFTPDANGDLTLVVQAVPPTVVDSVADMTDTTKAYVLSLTGEIWTFQTRVVGGGVPQFTNLFDKSKVILNMSASTDTKPLQPDDEIFSFGLIPYDFTGYDINNPSIVRIKGVDANGAYIRATRVAYYRGNPSDFATATVRRQQSFSTHVPYTVVDDETVSFPLAVRTDGTLVQGSEADMNLLGSFALSFMVADDNTVITMDDVPDLIITIDEEITYSDDDSHTVSEWASTGLTYSTENYEPRIKALEEDVEVLKTNTVEKAEETVYVNFSCENDFAIVSDEIWGSKNEDTYTRIVRHKIVNGVLTKLGEIELNDVIHLNTMDYCPENDCLITGNGANDTNTEGNCFWIIPNASNLPNLTGRLNLSDIAIQYNVDIGFKVQAIWGDGNLGQHNLVYLLSNNNEVRRAIIHKNEDGSFANTYTIVGDTFTITGASGFQGVDYYGGYIYMGFGGGEFVLAKVNTKDFTAVVTEYPYYKADGTAETGVFQGVVVDKDYLWLYPNGITSGNYLVKHTR